MYIIHLICRAKALSVSLHEHFFFLFEITQGFHFPTWYNDEFNFSPQYSFNLIKPSKIIVCILRVPPKKTNKQTTKEKKVQYEVSYD